MCKYNLDRGYAGDCSGCPASHWLNDGITRKGYYVSGKFSCKIEDGLMTVEEVHDEDKRYEDKEVLYT